MVRYEPPELGEKIAQAEKSFRKFMNEELFEYASGFSAADDEADVVVTSESEVELSLPRCDHHHTLRCGDLPGFVAELVTAQLEDNLFCWTSNRLLLRVAPMLSERAVHLQDLLDRAHYPDAGALATESVTHDGATVRCSVVGGFTPFGFLVARAGDYEKWYPPVMSEDLFVQVSWTGKADRQKALDVLASYLFELDATLGVSLVPSHRPTVIGVEPDREEEPASAPEPRLRPLLIGQGIADLIRSYNAAAQSSDTSYRILCFVKVLEYVSQTVLRMQLVDVVTAKLGSSRALEPDAAFILELEALINEAKVNRRERDALKLTVSVCCEASELTHVAPVQLRLLKQLQPNADEKTKRAATDEFASTLYATRNSIAHAKANYTATGDECLPEQMPALSECARVAAQQAIRWFAMRPERSRVT